MSDRGNGEAAEAAGRAAAFESLGFERMRHVPGSTYKDCSTVIVVPTRGIERHTKSKRCESGEHIECFLQAVHLKVFQSWQNLIAPMNQKRAFFYATGHEVGKAYDATISGILQDPNLSKWRFVLTLEDDNVVNPDLHIRLLESIDVGPFDAVGGLYYTKGEINAPMVYGDPEKYRRTGELEFAPRDLMPHVQRGENVIECNGLACGATLWRMDLFRSLPQPWFVTVSDIVQGKGAIGFTQDLYLCRLARQHGKRFAVDIRNKVGHIDVLSGVVY